MVALRLRQAVAMLFVTGCAGLSGLSGNPSQATEAGAPEAGNADHPVHDAGTHDARVDSPHVASEAPEAGGSDGSHDAKPREDGPANDGHTATDASLADTGPGDAGSGDARSLDAHPVDDAAAPVDDAAAPDAHDASDAHEAAAAPGYCATNYPTALFCDDFDDEPTSQPLPSTKWAVTPAGSVLVSTAESLSPPASAWSPVGSKATATYVATGVVNGLRVDADVFIPQADAGGATPGLSLTIEQGGVVVDYGCSVSDGKFYTGVVYNGNDYIINGDDVSPIPSGAWFRVTIEMVPSTSLTYGVSNDGFGVGSIGYTTASIGAASPSGVFPSIGAGAVVQLTVTANMGSPAYFDNVALRPLSN